MVTSLRFLFVSLATCVITSSIFAFASDFFKWTDETGATHYADSIAGVPEKYRTESTKRKFGKQRAKSTVRDLSGGSSSHSSSAKNKTGATNDLKKFEVPYRAYAGGAQRIIIPVTFNGSVTVPMLLDTGAPGLVISPRLADKLGVFESDDGALMWATGGIGGVTPATITILDSASIGDARDEFIPATITRSISGSFSGLIGMDFMSNFSINIDTRKHVLVFEELPPRQSAPAGHNERWWRSNFRRFAMMRTQWKKIRKKMTDRIKGTGFAGEGSHSLRMKKLADRQFGESEKLFNRLERYANYHSVPMHWRQY